MIIQSEEKKEMKNEKTEAKRQIRELKTNEYIVTSSLREIEGKVAESTVGIDSERSTSRHIIINLLKPKRKSKS